MKITSVFNDFTTNEYCLFGLFLLYLVVPFHTPNILYNFLVNPIGLIILLCTVVAMFFTMPPILAILYVLVVYELLRRDGNDSVTYRAAKPMMDNSSQQYEYVTDPVSVESVDSFADISNHPAITENYSDSKKESNYLPVGDSLEELMVSQMAPVEHGTTSGSTDFRPVTENSMGASAF